MLFSIFYSIGPHLRSGFFPITRTGVCRKAYLALSRKNVNESCGFCCATQHWSLTLLSPYPVCFCHCAKGICKVPVADKAQAALDEDIAPVESPNFQIC